MATLHLFRGYPGSGKSSTAYRLFPNLVKFENDMFLMRDGKYCWTKESVKDAIAWCINSVKTALDNGMDVCVCNTFTKKKFVEAYAKIAADRGANFEVYRCRGEFKNVHGLADWMVSKFKTAMEDWPGETIVDPV